MKILIHGINFSPELTGIGKYSGEMAEWLALQGHEVRVVTAPPYYPQWQVADGYSNTWQVQRMQCTAAGSDMAGDVLVYRCPLWVPAKPSGLKRLLHLASFALSSLPIMLRLIFWRSDVVLAVEPPLFCASQAWLVARLSGGKAWLHIQDFEVDAAFELGILKGNLIRKLVLAFERWLMKRFDRVSTISDRMLDRLLIKKVNLKHVVLFPNWVDIHTSLTMRPIMNGEDSPDYVDYRSELKIPTSALVALYSGNMGAKQGLEILAEAARLLRQKENIVFVFCGNGAGRDSLATQCAGLNNVRFMDLQPQERLAELLCMADIHLLPQRADAADLVMPSKLTGMLASGRAVLATAHVGTELENVVKNAGLVVPPGDTYAFAGAIIKLADNAKQREQFGVAGRKYAEQYLDKNIVLSKFENTLKQLVK